MEVDKKSMLIFEMTDQEAEAVQRTAEKIVLDGVIDWKRPEVALWMNHCCESETQRFLMASIAMPQRLLLSVLRHEVSRRKKAEDELRSIAEEDAGASI